MSVWPFEDLRPLYYRTILADPAWLFETRSENGEGKSPQSHYRCMPLDEMKALPVNQLAGDNCTLIMWATFPMLQEAFELMAAWGFDYKTGGAWAKQSSTGKKWAFGTGYKLRSASELFLVGTVGKPETLSKNTRNLIVAPVREHSRKPDEQYELAEAIGHWPYVELFSRTDRPGWDWWGDQSGMFKDAS